MRLINRTNDSKFVKAKTFLYFKKIKEWSIWLKNICILNVMDVEYELFDELPTF